MKANRANHLQNQQPNKSDREIAMRQPDAFPTNGRIKTIRFGRRLLIPDSEVQRIAEEGT